MSVEEEGTQCVCRGRQAHSVSIKDEGTQWFYRDIGDTDVSSRIPDTLKDSAILEAYSYDLPFFHACIHV